MTTRKSTSGWLFQFTPLREGRHTVVLTDGNRGNPNVFQFTPLREGRRALYGYNVFYQPFQFTPLREGRLMRFTMFVSSQTISIHAPPRGATTPTWAPFAQNVDFNSRPSARGDASRQRVFPRSNDFNSRPSARGDGV